MINQIPAAGQGRTPRGILMVGDTVIDWTAWSIEHSGVHEAGKIQITVPAPHWKWPWWTQQVEILVDVYAGFPSDPVNCGIADLTLLMTARIDKLRLDPARSVLTLEGRDLTSLFTDIKSDAKYQNMTASQIVAAAAEKFSVLTTDIQVTKQLVGVYYDADHVHMQQDSVWTLLTYLAQREGLQCFVLGKTLYFGEFGSKVSNQPYAIVFQPPTVERPYPTAKAEKLTFAHDMTLSGDVSVRVRSYHHAKNALYDFTAKTPAIPKAKEKSATVARDALSYDFTFPGLTKDQCEDRANKLLAAIGKHELTMEVTVPGDVQVFPWTPVTVTGTGTRFDDTYSVLTISRSFDNRGFLMNLSCTTMPSEKTIDLVPPEKTASAK